MKRKWIFPGLIALFFGLWCTVAVATQNHPADATSEDFDDISTLTMPEAKKHLDNIITAIEQNFAIIDELKNTRFEFGVADTASESSKEPSYVPNFSMLTQKEIDQRLAVEIKKPITFRQVITSSNSQVEINLHSLRELVAQAQPPDSQLWLSYKIQRIYFADGSETNRAEPQALNSINYHSGEYDTERLFGERFRLPVNKPIAKILIELTYDAYPDYKKIVLNRNKTEVTFSNGGYYQLVGIQGGSAAMVITEPKNSRYVIEGLTLEGKSLNKWSSNSYRLPSDEQIKILRHYYQQPVETRNNIDQYSDISDLQAHLKSLIPPQNAAQNTLPRTNLSIHFDSNPDSIAIYTLGMPQKNTIIKEIENSDSIQPLSISQDTESKLFGFIDKSGNWQIKPQFEGVFHTKVNGFYDIRMKTTSVQGTTSKEIDGYYFIDDKTKRLIKLPFGELSKVINNDLILVQKEINSSYGVYNVKNHQFVIPMEYVNVNIDIANNQFIASLGEKTNDYKRQYGVLTLQGKTIMPHKYERIDKVDSFFYATLSDGKQRNVYDLNGKQINPNDYQSIGFFTNNQPLLLEHNQTGKYQLINNKGQLLPIKLPYDGVSPFSNGMAVVREGHKYGAI
ncbi:MAG: WG repeat-containing protein, partial [Limnobaculum xujianqingii]